ncbi:MAG: carboxypeptidase-like regulatory domain-containing protein [Cyclobacteriaceae bacterium]|nr:carboxypeptidase-like regulatory domain-containing protein [Cyclobacteriaceae bacterium]
MTNSYWNKIKLIASLFFVSIAAISCLEQVVEPVSFGSLKGSVIDNFNGEPLAGVEINTNPSSSSVLSDSLGNFTIAEIATGEYSFTASLNGYEKTFLNATIDKKITAEINFKMDRQVILPDPPTNPTPAAGASQQPRNITLTWNSTTPKNDSLSFDVFVWESNIDSAVFSSINSIDTFLVLKNLRYETTYFWQVNAISATGGKSNGEVWSFSTIQFPDNRFTFATNVKGNYQIYSTNDSTDQKIQITRTSYNSVHPLFSNGRAEIAYGANKNLDYQIHLMDFKGNNSRQITNIPIAGFHNTGTGFCWWPDNGGFIYSNYENLYSIDRNGSNLTLVSKALPGRNFGNSDYSGSTNKIVVQTVGSLIYQGEIYLMNDDGSDTVRIVDDLPGIINYPTFSIDGKQVMYTRDVSGFDSADGRQLDAHIFILDLLTMQTIDVSGSKPAGTNDLQPHFSPFGSQIIFANVLNDGSGIKSVYIMDVDGANRKLLFENAEMPNWK